jgi:GTP cyclohydrolase I
VAHISSYCDLSADKKGINMSRNSRVLIEELEKETLELHKLGEVVRSLADAHQTNNITLKLWFEYIFETKSPVTKLKSFEPAVVTAEYNYSNGEITKLLQVISVESSCCPCSKNMSLLVNHITDEQQKIIDDIPDQNLVEKIKSVGYGAHNQRSEIDIKVELASDTDIMWIEDLIAIAKKASSAETFNVLKREDERWVTEEQYNNPKFCEDIARDAASLLNDELDKRIKDYVVVVNNDESIHTSLMATAIITANRKLS